MTMNEYILYRECLDLLKKIRSTDRICCMDISHWHHRMDVEIEYIISIFNPDGISIKAFHDLTDAKDYLLEFIVKVALEPAHKTPNNKKMFHRIKI